MTRDKQKARVHRSADVTLRIVYDEDECLDPHDWDWGMVLNVQMTGKMPQVLSVAVMDSGR